ncbi:MAG: DUF998 domain-containing protein [Streptosporangiales bacterium]|nr:DUF998 domain-containing protein [Streptosporangiales bacterium]
MARIHATRRKTHLPAGRTEPRSTTGRSAQVAGALLSLAGMGILMGIVTGEALYPGSYSTHRNTVSDLAATRPLDIVLQPSATIFNVTIIVTGAAILAAAGFAGRATSNRTLTVLIALLGVGVAGVGFFPGDHGAIHAILTQIAFIAGGLAAIVASWASKPPFRFLSLVLGVTSLGFLTLYTVVGPGGVFVGSLGEGGTERWIAYPVVLWLVGYGSYLTASGARTPRPGPPSNSSPKGPDDAVTRDDP